MLEAKECEEFERMKAGINGCDNISSVYLENLQNSPLIEVVAVADLLEERAEEFNVENVYKFVPMPSWPTVVLGSHACFSTFLIWKESFLRWRACSSQTEDLYFGADITVNPS
ncbi:hypothetical protein [Paenibacillus brasilensis]|uniref:Uncharacterized protein n=1 Tax=Paenibacillus brasilensis TaxID=128574 RepID=A0ABU0KS26_9BACL|nr:hypothetical protein [Paenibacillus brasilensis]MDQ0492150.1 hypothetical protein [Paenibacillus brasilensis]